MGDDRVASFATVDDALDWAHCHQLVFAAATAADVIVATSSAADEAKASSSSSSKWRFSPLVRRNSAPVVGGGGGDDDNSPHVSTSSLLKKISSGDSVSAWSSLEDDTLTLAAARFVLRNVLKVAEQYENLAVSSIRRVCRRERVADPGNAIFRPGDLADKYFLALSGSIELSYAGVDLETGTYLRGVAGKATVRKASFFGFVDVYAAPTTATPSKRSTAATPREKSTVAVFAISDHDHIFKHAPEVALLLQRALLHRGARELIVS